MTTRQGYHQKQMQQVKYETSMQMFYTKQMLGSKWTLKEVVQEWSEPNLLTSK